MKIVHFAKFYFPDSGGIETVTRDIAEFTADNSIPTTVICFAHNKSPHIEKINEVQVIRSKILFTLASQPFSLAYIYYCIIESFNSNIIHLHAPNILASIAAILISFRKKIVIHWHSDILNKGILNIFVMPFQKLMLIRANKIVVTSNEYFNSSRELKNYLYKTCVIPIGVKSNASLQNTVDNISQNLINLTTEKKVILSVGRLVDYKGFDSLIKSSTDILNDAIIVIVGDGPERLKLQKLINDLKLNDRVYLLGKISNVDLNYLYNSASLFCLLSNSRSEAFGVVLVEALSYALPIVSTNLSGSGMNWINQHGITGYKVNLDDPISISIACNNILNSELLRSKFSRNALNRYLLNFTDQKMNEMFLNLYKEFLF